MVGWLPVGRLWTEVTEQPQVLIYLSASLFSFGSQCSNLLHSLEV